LAERFELVHDTFWDLKHGTTVMTATILLRFLYFLSGYNATLVLKFLNSCSSKSFMVLSNLKGPQVQLEVPYVDGQTQNARIQVKAVFNGTNPTKMPIAVGVESYLDDIKFSVITDDGFFPEGPHQILRFLHEEFLSQSRLALQ